MLDFEPLMLGLSIVSPLVQPLALPLVSDVAEPAVPFTLSDSKFQVAGSDLSYYLTSSDLLEQLSQEKDLQASAASEIFESPLREYQSKGIRNQLDREFMVGEPLLNSDRRSPDNPQEVSVSSESELSTVDGQATRVGTNLNAVTDWSTQHPFLNLFKTSRSWIPQREGLWNTEEADQLDLDEYGWVKSLPDPDDPNVEYTHVATLMNYYHGGEFVVLYDGEGTIEYGLDVAKDREASAPGRDVIESKQDFDQPITIQLKVTETDPNQTGDYIRNIRVVPIEYEDNYDELVFNPEFLEKVDDFGALRFMDWMQTNNSEQRTWEERPEVEDARYTVAGVPLEIMIELANELDRDPWFNIPHMATDNYVSQFAQVVEANLEPELEVYVEYSNEVWNAQFEQYSWVRDNGPIEGDPYKSYGVRSAQINEIWKEEFDNDYDRVQFVLGTQTRNRWVADQVLNYREWDPTAEYEYDIDAIAITGYISGNLGDPQHESTIESWITDPNIDEFAMAVAQIEDGSVLDDESGTLVETAENFQYYSELAQQHGLEVVVYEGGSHVVGRGGVQNNELITDFFIELHRREEFYDLYTQLLESWEDPNGIRTLYMNFLDIGTPSRWGSWGTLETVAQDSSPRYDALIDFIRNHQ